MSALQGVGRALSLLHAPTDPACGWLHVALTHHASPPPNSDLSQNALTGGLPPEWGMLPALASLDASSNYLTGGLPEGWGALGQAQELRLASNNLGVSACRVE